jgi:sec-independent protein translocase protein TatA
MFAMLNGWEVVAILAVVLVLFGAKKLPELAKGLGQGIKEFKKSSRELQEEMESAMDVNTPPPPRRQSPVVEEPVRSIPASATQAHIESAPAHVEKKA